MLYRVYNISKKKWIYNVCLTPDGQLFALKQPIFGKTKSLVELSQNTHVYHKSIDLWDKNEKQIFEGDIIKAQVADNREVIGLVTFASELSAYIILCDKTNEYFTLGDSVCSYIEIIGNVFDGYKEDEKDGQQALQESEV